MTYLVHENQGFEGARRRFFWYDHFEGDQLKDEWLSAIAGAGTNALVDSIAGGICRLTTGAVTNNNNILRWGNFNSLLTTHQVANENRVRLNEITENNLDMWLRNSGLTPRIGWYWDSDFPPRFYKGCFNAAGSTGSVVTDSVDTNFHLYRMQCMNHGGVHVHFYIDNVEQASSPITTNVPTDNHLSVMFQLRTQEDVAKSVDIDYVGVRM